MNRFAELLDRLAYEPGRNNKLRLITNYFRAVEDPDRGYALAALTGALSFKHAKPGLIRDLIADRTDSVLFALSYDYVGDLSETVALMWPKRTFDQDISPPSPTGGGAAQRSGRRPQTNLKDETEAFSVPSPLWGRARGGYRGHDVRDDKRDHHCHNNPLLPPSPRSSPHCARSARPNCRSNSHAGSMNWTKPAAGRC